MANMSGLTAIVTGAARRIGRATALALAAAGANVVVHYGTSGREADEVCAEMARLGVRCSPVGAELGDSQAVETLFEQAMALSGRVDVIVNNASIFDETAMEEATEAQFADNFRINALAPFLLTRLLARHVRSRDAAAVQSGNAGGSVVNLLDTRISDYDRRHVPYAVSKRSLYSLTKMCALEFAPELRVNAVAPGLVLPPAGQDTSYLERLASTNPLNTYGNPEQVTDAVLFLLGNDFVTGQVIYVDGGRHLKGSLYGE